MFSDCNNSRLGFIVATRNFSVNVFGDMLVVFCRTPPFCPPRSPSPCPSPAERERGCVTRPAGFLQEFLEKGAGVRSVWDDVGFDAVFVDGDA